VSCRRPWSTTGRRSCSASLSWFCWCGRKGWFVHADATIGARLGGLASPLIRIGLVLAVAVLTELFGSPVLSRFVIRMLIDMVLVLGLQIFMGNTNLLWFPHVGFMGIGAYASVIFSMEPFQKLLSLPELYPFLADVHLPFLPAL